MKDLHEDKHVREVRRRGAASEPLTPILSARSSRRLSMRRRATSMCEDQIDQSRNYCAACKASQREQRALVLEQQGDTYQQGGDAAEGREGEPVPTYAGTIANAA